MCTIIRDMFLLGDKAAPLGVVSSPMFAIWIRNQAKKRKGLTFFRRFEWKTWGKTSHSHRKTSEYRQFKGLTFLVLTCLISFFTVSSFLIDPIANCPGLGSGGPGHGFPNISGNNPMNE